MAAHRHHIDDITVAHCHHINDIISIRNRARSILIWSLLARQFSLITTDCNKNSKKNSLPLFISGHVNKSVVRASELSPNEKSFASSIREGGSKTRQPECPRWSQLHSANPNGTSKSTTVQFHGNWVDATALILNWPKQHLKQSPCACSNSMAPTQTVVPHMPVGRVEHHDNTISWLPA